MQLFPLTQPGSMLRKQDGNIDRDKQVLLTLLQSAYYDCTLALHCYSGAVDALTQHMRSDNPFSSFNGMPREILMRSPQLHARSFVYALDNFQLALKAIGQGPDAPDEIATIINDFESSFPRLRANRNTAHHMDERAQGLGANSRPNSAINILLLDTIIGDNRYTNTLADGTQGSVEISTASMLTLQSLCQRALNALPWLDNHSYTLPRSSN